MDERKVIEWDNGLLPGGRRPKLWLICEGRISRFGGIAIPKVCALAAEPGYTKNGKWSKTTFSLIINPARTVPCHLVAPLHGKTWPFISLTGALASLNERVQTELPGAPAVSEQEFREAMMVDYPRTLEAWDEAKVASDDL